MWQLYHFQLLMPNGTVTTIAVITSYTTKIRVLYTGTDMDRTAQVCTYYLLQLLLCQSATKSARSLPVNKKR